MQNHPEETQYLSQRMARSTDFPGAASMYRSHTVFERHVQHWIVVSAARYVVVPLCPTHLPQRGKRCVEIFHQQLTAETVDDFVEQAIANDIKKVTIRTPLDPSSQPKIQGSFDRQLARRSGKRDGFIIQHPNSQMSMLCVIE